MITKKMTKGLKKYCLLGAITGVALVVPDVTYAAALPWETPLTDVKDSLTTVVAPAFAVIGLVGAGIAMFFGEGGPAGKFLARGIFGIGIALSAASVVASLFVG